MDINALLMYEVKLQQLTEGMACQPEAFAQELERMLEIKVDMNPTKRAQVLVACRANKQAALLERLMKVEVFREPAVIAKMLAMLDAPRELRAAQCKLARLQKGGDGQLTPRKATLSALKEKINNLGQQDALAAGSVGANGSLARWVERWAKEIPAERLEFYLLHFSDSLDMWRKICDVAHLKPGSWQLDYFQRAVFEGVSAAPEGSLVAASLALSAESLGDVLAKHPSLFDAYSFLRQRVEMARVPEETKAVLAEVAPLEDMLWYYEEVACPGTDQALRRRLENGEAIAADGHAKANYGKLMERLLLLKKRQAPFWRLLLPHAEARMAELRAQVAAANSGGTKVVVFGDASASMQVAVNSATIIGSMLCSLFSGAEGTAGAPASEADLLFFNSKMFRSALGVPKTAEECLAVTEEVKANCPTAPAAALAPFLQAKKSADLFVVVTDEVENTRADGMYFAEMWKRYLSEVNPLAKVVFVSFLRREEKGQMLSAMQRHELEVAQFKMDPQRPDLSKFDSLLAMLLLEIQKVHANASAAAGVLQDSAAATADETPPAKDV